MKHEDDLIGLRPLDEGDALGYAEWLVTESKHARGQELSWDAAVIAGASMVVAEAIEGMHECMHGPPEESDDDT